MGKEPMTSESIARPLRGQRTLVTRPQHPGDPLVERLRELGSEVLMQPAIRITAPPDWRPVDRALLQLDTFDWLVFSSANGVRSVMGRLEESEAAAGNAPPLPHTMVRRRFASVKLAAIGPGTAVELSRYGLQTDLIPEQYSADALAELLCHDAKGRRFLLARASRGREVLAEQLTAAGADVVQVVVYSSMDVAAAAPSIVAMLEAGKIDWITVTSSAIARSLARMFGERLHRSKLASISPLTSGALRRLGYKPAVEATEYTIPGLVAAIVGGKPASEA